jgi:uncharacterized membrane protein YraQ (UPF0718 family)
MKEFIKKNIINLALLVAFGVFVLVSFLSPFQPGIAAAGSFADFLLEFISFIPFMFILIGLFDVWFPKAVIEKHIGKDSGWRGIFWVTLLAMLQAGPLYGAFPVAYLLWRKGSSVRNIFIYLGAFSTMKIPMLGFEIGFLGLKFTLLRSLVTIPLFILIGFVMERLLKKMEFKINDPNIIAKEKGAKREP